MEGGGATGASERRAFVYCVIPRDLAATFHDPLRRHFAADASVEVVVERRADDRRRPAERRREVGGEAAERRRIRNAAGRRIADRRAAAVVVDGLPLPRRLVRHRDRIVFIERIEPSTEDLEDVDTARLVTRFQAGDNEIFSTIYMRYFDRVYAYLRVVLRDSHEAEDATQHVFTRVLQSLGAYERRRQPFRAWLFVIVRNHALDQLRRSNRLTPMEPEELNRRRAPEASAVELSGLDWIADRELLMFIERLPLAQRQVLVLRFMLDLSSVQIAEILGRSPVEIRKLQHRALMFLRERLAAVGRTSERSSERSSWQRRLGQVGVLRERRYALIR